MIKKLSSNIILTIAEVTIKITGTRAVNTLIPKEGISSSLKILASIAMVNTSGINETKPIS